MLHIKKLISEERAAASIVEYTIVLPICLFVLVFIFMVGYYLNQQAVLEAAVDRGVLAAQKIYNDPNADKLLDMGDKKKSTLIGFKRKANVYTDGTFEYDPYRYLNNNYKSDQIKSVVLARVNNAILDTQLVNINERVQNLKIECSDVSGIINKELTVTAKQEFIMPLLPTLFDKLNNGNIFTIQASSKVVIMNPTEFIRNTDFVVDTIERYVGTDITEKMSEIFGKITSFFQKTKGGE